MRLGVDGNRGWWWQGDHGTHPAACFIVVQVHEDASTLIGALGMDSFSFSCVHKFLGKTIAIVDVVPAAAPQPVPRQVFGARSSAAATGGQLALPACSAHGVHYTSSAHRICEGRLSAACGQGWRVTRLLPPRRRLDLVLYVCVWLAGGAGTKVCNKLACAGWRRLREHQHTPILGVVEDLTTSGLGH